MSKLSISQRIHNAVASRAVEEIKAIHAYVHGIGYNREEWDTLWSQSPNTTWGHAFGRMVGPEEIYLNSVAHCDKMACDGFIACIDANKEFWGHDIRSAGMSGTHSLASSVIEVAEDGQSARSFYLTPGGMIGARMRLESKNERFGGWIWERYGSDFVLENGKWLYFHEQVCPDIDSEYDTANWAYDEFAAHLENPINEGSMGGDPARLTDPGPLHFNFTCFQTVQDTVVPPKPYKTLDDEHSYSTPGRNTV